MERFDNALMDVQVSLERIKVFPCATCSAAFLKEEDLHKHSCFQYNNNNRIDFKWEKENNKNYINKSEQNEEYVKKYKCLKCDRKFVLLSTLEAHQQVHSRQHKCHCGIEYYKIKDLKEHQKLLQHKVIEKVNQTKKRKTKSDSKSIRFECDICKKYFPSKINVFLHIQGVHENIKPYTCEICSKSYSQSHNLKSHLNSHANIKPFACSLCDKTFTRKSGLNRHRDIHSGVKRYSCDFCLKKFSDPSARITHMRIHTKTFKYVCDKCPKKYTDAGALARHKNSHEKSVS